MGPETTNQTGGSHNQSGTRDHHPGQVVTTIYLGPETSNQTGSNHNPSGTGPETRLNRFSHIVLKLTLGLQNLRSFFRFALFDGEIYPLEPISKEWTDTSLVFISVIKCSYLFIFWFWALAFLIVVSNGTESSKISIFSSIR